MATRDEHTLPALRDEREATPPDRPCCENPPGGRSFARGLRWLGPYSPLRGCAGLAALSTAKIPCRRTPFNFQTGSEPTRGRCIPKSLARLGGRANGADGLRVGPQSGRRYPRTRCPSGAAAGRHLLTPPKNETVILVIYGCFWLFLIQIFDVTHWFKEVCVNFWPGTPRGPGFRGRRCKKCTNNFGMNGPGEAIAGPRTVTGWSPLLTFLS